MAGVLCCMAAVLWKGHTCALLTTVMSYNGGLVLMSAAMGQPSLLTRFHCYGDHTPGNMLRAMQMNMGKSQ